MKTFNKTLLPTPFESASAFGRRLCSRGTVRRRSPSVASSDVVDSTSDVRSTRNAAEVDRYVQTLQNLDDIRDALSMDVSDEVYETTPMILMTGRYESFTQGLES